MIRVLIVIICFFGFIACLEIPKKSDDPYVLGVGQGYGNSGNGVQGLTYSSLPLISLLCNGSEVPDICDNVIDLDVGPSPASDKFVYVIWNAGRTCDENENNIYAQGVSQDDTINGLGRLVTLASDAFNYQGGKTQLPFGSYAMWLAIDSDGTAGIQPGEAIHCHVVDVISEVGAIARNSGWRRATATDEALFSSAGY